MNTLPKLLMHLEDYPEGLKVRCFEFFYWFSRFEYSLKENGYLGRGPYNAAIPNWTKFRTRFAKIYEPSNAARKLLAEPPWRQIWNAGAAGWERLNLDREKTDLGRSILVVKTIRNNLFHGGKSNEKDWDEPDRNIFFLSNGKEVLDSFANLGNLLADYRRHY